MARQFSRTYCNDSGVGEMARQKRKSAFYCMYVCRRVQEESFRRILKSNELTTVIKFHFMA